MAGEYTRLGYEQDAYKEEVARSTGPLMYQLDTNSSINCKRCFAPYGPVGGLQGSDVVGNQTDIDSILRGITKMNTKSNKYQVPDSLDEYNLYAYNNCSPQLEQEYTRYTYPPSDIRGLTVPDMRFDYPLQDPQCQIFENFAVNTRLESKDAHRTVWQIPLEQSDAFPAQRLGKPKHYGYPQSK